MAKYNTKQAQAVSFIAFEIRIRRFGNCHILGLTVKNLKIFIKKLKNRIYKTGWKITNKEIQFISELKEKTKENFEATDKTYT
jgi:hypothetical protein